MQVFSLDTVIDVLTLPPSGPFACRVQVDGSACAELAERFGFLGLSEVDAKLTIRKVGPGIWDVNGRLVAQVVQACIVTGSEVPEEVDFEIEERYVRVSENAEEVVVTLDDAEPLVNGGIDLGEMVAQSLALAVNAWPRSDGAPDSFHAGEEGPTHPFAGLAALKSSDK